MSSPMLSLNRSSRNNHAVWDVYDDYRTSMMNVRIQKAHIRRLRRLNYWVEIPLALVASSTVAGLWFWTSAAGGAAWKYLGVIIAFLAVLKPILKVPDKIQQRAEMLGDVGVIENQLEKLVKQIAQRRKFDKPLCERYNKIIDLKGEFKNKYYARYLENSKSIKRRCQQQVEQLYPGDKFFVPEDDKYDR